MSSALQTVDTLIRSIDTQSESKKPEKTRKTEKKMKARGAFIVFEGIDRCGKSSQCKKLLSYLATKNTKHEFYRFPNRESLTGKIINDYLTNKIQTLDDRCIHLLFAANRHEAKQAIVDDLNAGVNVICDRYSYSGIAYSSSKELSGADTSNMSLEWCTISERGLPKPDCVLFLNLSVDDAQKRGSFGEERYEKSEFQKKVKCAFDAIIKTEQATNPYTKWQVIDANRDIDAIHTEIVGIASQTIDGLNQESNFKMIEFYQE